MFNIHIMSAYSLSILLGELHLYDDVLALRGIRLHVHAIPLILETLLIILALEYLCNDHWIFQEHGNQSLQHLLDFVELSRDSAIYKQAWLALAAPSLVCLVAEDALDDPVESYVTALLCHGQHIFR